MLPEDIFQELPNMKGKGLRKKAHDVDFKSTAMKCENAVWVRVFIKKKKKKGQEKLTKLVICFCPFKWKNAN